ncbi:VanZ family protein [Ornithinibacillus sp. FSL M8-0202]|uniref:VanZ family protein n=1 Tax=Ornithinibacillus sp. FSL M8-0202 TaxID=2921616 RepID=UPI0030D07C0F
MLPILSFKFRKFFPSIILVILFSLTVELLQYATQLGVFDVDDIILNALGGSIGFLIFIIMKRRMS